MFSIFVVWFVKALLLKVGGIQLYRKAIPAVLGMLVAFVLGVFLSTWRTGYGSRRPAIPSRPGDRVGVHLT